MASSCFDPSSLIFTSPRPPLFIPPDLDMVSFLFAITCARPFHQRVAIADASTGQSLTFSRLRRHIQTTALCLSLLGVKQHDVVMIVSPNSVDFPVAFFAIISLGAVATTVNPRNTSIEILKQAKDSTAKLILTVPELADKVSHSGLPIMLINGEPLQKGNPSVKLLSEVMKHASAHQMPPIKIHQTDPAALMYTSGTTGVSKGAILSHRNFIAAALQVNLDADTHQETDLTFLCCVPMFHVYGLCVIVFGQLQKGNTIITMPKFDLIHMLEAVQAYHITNLPLVPPIMVALTKEDVIRKYDLSSVIETTSGAAPVSKEILEEVYQRLKIPDIRRGYGMTEASGRISIAILKTIKKNYATVGPLVSGMEAVVVDPNSGKRLPPNKQGELWVRGPNIMQGYLNNQEATASVLDEDGWLRTGDLVYIDDEGNLFIVGRLKELIKYKGLQVAPAELEALLLTHFEIIDAAVVPIPDDYAGEVPLAYVVRSAGSSLREHDVIQFVEAQQLHSCATLLLRLLGCYDCSSCFSKVTNEERSYSLSGSTVQEGPEG